MSSNPMQSSLTILGSSQDVKDCLVLCPMTGPRAATDCQHGDDSKPCPHFRGWNVISNDPRPSRSMRSGCGFPRRRIPRPVMNVGVFVRCPDPRIHQSTDAFGLILISRCQTCPFFAGWAPPRMTLRQRAKAVFCKSCRPIDGPLCTHPQGVRLEEMHARPQ